MSLQSRNNKTLMLTLGIVFTMIALSFASVPLYRALCHATGWGGTTATVEKNTSQVYDREIIVQFNADTDPHLPWVFKPDQRRVKVKVGADAIISYMVLNKGKVPITGTAVHNVTPMKAGKYFNKTQCFCFGAQTLQPGQKLHLPVVFFIDPKIMDDRELKDLRTITLSYTFYRHDSPQLEKAVEKISKASDNPPKVTK
jgi:cytochrome c oxidase assembly protein subunit 11